MSDQNDFVWMQPPDGGEPVQVPADEVGPKMFQGYRQVEPPAPKHEEPLRPQSAPGLVDRLLGREDK